MPICLPNTETTARLVSESHFKLAGFSADQGNILTTRPTRLFGHFSKGHF